MRANIRICALAKLLINQYATNSSGVLDEFICHAGWYNTKLSAGAECVKLFVNKFYAIGNLHLSY